MHGMDLACNRPLATAQQNPGVLAPKIGSPLLFIPSIPSSLFRLGDEMHGMDLACNRPLTTPQQNQRVSR